MNINSKYIQKTQNGKYDVIFPESIKSPRRLGRFKTIEKAQVARDEYLEKCGFLSTVNIQGKAEIHTDNHFFLVALADTHGGHNQGLLNPETKLDDDGNAFKPKLTKIQKWLWKFYQYGIDKVFDVTGDVPIVLAHVGDLTQGTKYKDNHVSDRLSDQIFISHYNIKPWFERGVRKAILLKGTSSHAFGDGSSDLLIAEWLKARFKDVAVKTVYHALLRLGVDIDIAHHGPHPGSRQWTRGNVARSYLLDRMLECVTSVESPSRLYLRGHYHAFVREYLNRFGYESDLIVLPSFCGLGAYGHQATKSISHSQHGLVLFEIKDSRLKDIMPIVEKYDCRVKVYL